MVEDLSHHHSPIGELVELSASPEDAARHRLDDEQIRSYREDGFVAGIRVLDDEQVDVLRAELDALMEPSCPGRELFYEYHANESRTAGSVVFHALGAWRVAPGFHDALWNPAFTVPAAQLLEAPVRLWHDQLFCKPPRDGGVVAWHQDYSYWTRTTPLNHLTCWIALDDATVENGCVHYVPGSHRWSLLPTTAIADDMEAILRVLTPEQRAAFRPVPAEVRQGEAIFHHPLTLHGSHENRSERPRRGFVINAFADGTRSNSSETLLDGVPPVPPGELLGGRFFPLLHDPSAPAPVGS